MGDAPMAFVETTGGVRVAEDDLVSVGKNDVSLKLVMSLFLMVNFRSFLSRLVELRDEIQNKSKCSRWCLHIVSFHPQIRHHLLLLLSLAQLFYG